jgi:chemotaxis protein CheX
MKREAKSAKPQVLSLGESLDLAAAAPLQAEILGLRGGPLTLDASSVLRVGGLCLQVLLAARTAWRSDDRAFSVADASPEFRSCLERVGAGDLIEGTS